MLRQVDQQALLQHAAVPTLAANTATNTLDDGDLADVFGLDMDAGMSAPVAAKVVARVPARPKETKVVVASVPARPKETKVVASVPARPKETKVVVASVPARPKATKAPPPAAAFALGVLQEHRDHEFSTQDLFDWQKEPQFSTQAIAAALLHLRAKGQVASDKDQRGTVYWRAASAM